MTRAELTTPRTAGIDTAYLARFTVLLMSWIHWHKAGYGC